MTTTIKVYLIICIVGESVKETWFILFALKWHPDKNVVATHPKMWILVESGKFEKVIL